MSDLKFTQTHEWLKEEGNECIIGISFHAQEALGDLVYIELPKVGALISKGEQICVVESVKAAADVYSPITGEVTAINQEVVADPSLINHSPYDKGWLFKLKPTDLSEMNALMDESSYDNMLAAEGFA